MIGRWLRVVSVLLVSVFPVGGLALAQTSMTAAPTPAASRGARTVPYHARNLVALRAKVRYTTMIVLPEGEDILEATCGDKEFWIVNAHGAIAYVKPAKAGSETNLNLRTARAG